MSYSTTQEPGPVFYRPQPENVIALSPETCRWLLGHLRDELPELRKRLASPPFVRHAIAVESAQEAISRLEEVVEAEDER